MQAYASLGGQDAGKDALEKLGGALMARKEVVEVAAAHGKSTADVLLRWATQQGFAVIPKSSTAARMKANLAGASGGDGFTLSDGEMVAINRLEPAAASEAAKAARLCWRADPLKHLEFD